MSSPKRPTKQPAPQPPELKAIEQPAEKPAEQTPEQPAEQPPEQPPEQSAEQVAEQVTEQVTEQATEQATDEPAAALTPSAPDDLVAHSIMVRCKRPTGIWRGGRFWSAEQVTVPLDELTEEQIERIVTEPLLAFAFVAGEPALTITVEV